MNFGSRFSANAVNALSGVLAREELAEAVTLTRQVVGVLPAQRAVDRLLRRLERDRALGRELARQLQYARHQLLGLVDRVHEPALPRLLCSDGAAGEDQLLRESDRRGAGESLGPSPPRNDPQVDLGLAQLGVGRGVPDVAGQGELAAAAEREAVDGCDGRLAHRLEQPARLVAERAPLLRLVDVQPAHVLDVRSGDEGSVARAREDDDSRVDTARKLGQPIPQ